MPLRLSRILTVVTLFLLLAGQDLEAQTRRGLLVGINRYDAVDPARMAAATQPGTGRGRITNLNGAVNDATAMRDVLVASFGFDAQNVTVLTDHEATRDGIIGSIERLLEQSQRGDVVVFYYAGHGSQRRNTLSRQMSQLDQTIVVADANAGAEDIRDKEMARLFNPFIDKGVELILIFDSCHSGSIMRGGLGAHGPDVLERWAAIDERDARDPGLHPDSVPERRGALVISASQDYQSALERRGPGGQSQGVFTTALLETLRSVPPSEPAAAIFRRLKARMQMDGLPQEPVLAALPDRQLRPLLGGAAAEAGRTSVAVLRVETDGTVMLQGGPALGIREGAELRKIATGADAQIRLTVDSVVGVSRVRARVTAGDRQRVAVGDLFELERWVSAPAAGLVVAMASPGPDAAALQAIADEISNLRGEQGIEWIDDPTTVPVDTTLTPDRVPPMYVMQWSGTGWELRGDTGAAVALPRNPTAARVREIIRAREQDRTVRFFLALPPTPALTARIRTAIPEGSSVTLVSETASASYALVGRAGGTGLQYALVRPTASQATAGFSPMPQRTDWLELGSGDSASVARLVEHAYTLARVRSWLMLDAPPGTGSFPYRLAFRRERDGALITDGPFLNGDTFLIELVADSAQITERIDRRRIYIFAINNDGRGVLLYPQSGNVENRVPFARAADGRWPTRIELGDASRIVVRPPFGVNALILLSSDEPIETWAFEWAGVRGATRGAVGTLTHLLDGAGGRMRSVGGAAPMSWSVDRIVVRTQPAD